MLYKAQQISFELLARLLTENSPKLNVYSARYGRDDINVITALFFRVPLSRVKQTAVHRPYKSLWVIFGSLNDMANLHRNIERVRTISDVIDFYSITQNESSLDYCHINIEVCMKFVLLTLFILFKYQICNNKVRMTVLEKL